MGEKTQAYAVKNADGWLIPWTTRCDPDSAINAYTRICRQPGWQDLLECGYSVVKVRLVEEEAG